MTERDRPPAGDGAAAAVLAYRFGWLLALGLLFALREARALLAPVAIALTLTFVLVPLVRRLRQWGIAPGFGAGLVVAALLGTTVPLAASLANPAAEWLQKLPTTVAQVLAQIDRLRAALPVLSQPPSAARELPVPQPLPSPAPSSTPRGPGRAAQVPSVVVVPAPAPAVDPLKERLASEGVALTGLLLGRGLSFVVTAAATLILLYFLLASEHWILSRCVAALPRRRTRALLLGGLRSAQREIGHFLLTQGVINAVVGVITGLALWGLGLPNPTLWGVLVGVLCYVPYLGPLVLMGLLLTAGLVSFDTPRAMLAPVLAFGLVHALESNLVSPWVVGRRLALTPLSVFASVMFWGWLWGIAGALIAVPMLIALRSLCRRHRRLQRWAGFLEGERRAPPSLPALLRRSRQNR